MCEALRFHPKPLRNGFIQRVFRHWHGSWITLQLCDTVRAVIPAGYCLRSNCGIQRWQGPMCGVLRQERLHRCYQYLQARRKMIRLKVCYRISRMCGGAENRRPDGLQPPLQFQRKDEVGQLGLRIRLEHRLIDALALQIIELNFALVTCRTRHRHNTRARYWLDGWKQQHRQGKRPKIVRGELALKPIRSYFTRRQRHYARIVDQQVERLAGESFLHAACEGVDGIQHGKVEYLRMKPCVRDLLQNACG